MKACGHAKTYSCLEEDDGIGQWSLLCQVCRLDDWPLQTGVGSTVQSHRGGHQGLFNSVTMWDQQTPGNHRHAKDEGLQDLLHLCNDAWTVMVDTAKLKTELWTVSSTHLWAGFPGRRCLKNEWSQITGKMCFTRCNLKPKENSN